LDLLILKIVFVLPEVELEVAAEEFLSCELLHSGLRGLQVDHADVSLSAFAHDLFGGWVDDVLVGDFDFQDLACLGELLNNFFLGYVGSESLHEEVGGVVVARLLAELGVGQLGLMFQFTL